MALPFVLETVIVLEKPAGRVSRIALERFGRQAQKCAGFPGDVTVLIAGNRRLRELNRRFRRRDKPTDVLSFPRDGGGDIAISLDIARQNATRYGHAVSDEIKVLILHGILHLAGHDHETDRGEMARLEARLRARLKLPASLTERSTAAERSPRRLRRRP